MPVSLQLQSPVSGIFQLTTYNRDMRLLIVEDDHRIAASLKKGLEQERHAVDLSHDGSEGFDLGSEENYDVIILDRLLPGMDGVQICRQLRKNGIHTPILMLTAKSQIHERIEGLDAGADDYLPKPFAFAELLARIRSLTRRPKKIVEQVLSIDDLFLNLRDFEVTRANKTILLSRKEFALLEYLMRHPGKILTKDQIINNVWEYDADILPNTVEVYIGYLRNKIDKPFKDKSPLIHTARGFGYKIGTI